MKTLIELNGYIQNIIREIYEANNESTLDLRLEYKENSTGVNLKYPKYVDKLWCRIYTICMTLKYEDQIKDYSIVLESKFLSVSLFR